MNMSLRMEQWTPPEWQSIIELVADPRTVRKLAEYRLRWNVRALRDRIFLLLADHWVVDAELSLDRAVQVDRQRLAALLEEADMDVTLKDDTMTVDLDGYNVLLATEARGVTRFTTPGRLPQSVCVTLKEESVVRLLQFIEVALPAIEEKAEEIVLEEKREEMVTNIFEKVLRAKLDELGEQYTLQADERFITVHVRLKPNRALRFCVRSEKVPEMTGKLEGLIAAANALNREFWDTGMRII